MIDTITLKIEGKPQPKQRPRRAKSGHFYTPKETTSAEAHIKTILKLKDIKRMEGPLLVQLIFSFKRPKSVKREKPSVKPDLDNLVKLALDACNGICFKDDGQIVQINAKKVYSDSEYTHIKITPA